VPVIEGTGGKDTSIKLCFLVYLVYIHVLPGVFINNQMTEKYGL